LNLLQKIRAQIQSRKDLSLGIDRGTYALRYVLVNLEKRQILQYGSFQIPSSEEISFEQGSDYHQFKLFLKEISKKVPLGRIASIHTNIRGSSVVMGNLQVPLSSPKKQGELFREALKEKVPFSMEDATYIYREYYPSKMFVQTEAESSKNKGFFHFICVPKTILMPILEPVQETFHLIPEINSEGYAEESLIPLLGLPEPKKTFAIINVGKNTTIISIFQNQKLVFERDIPLASQDLSRAVSTLQPKEMPSYGFKEMLEKNSQSAESMEGILAAWKQDIRLSFSFFNEHYGGDRISKIYVTGGGTHLSHLSEYMTHELGIETELLTLPETASLTFERTSDQESFEKEFRDYATALALAMQPHGCANLTPQEFYASPWERAGGTALRMGAVAILALFFTFFVFLNAQIHTLREMRDILGGQWGFLQKLETIYNDMIQWDRFLKKVDSRVLSASGVFELISHHAPPRLLIWEFSLNRDQGMMVIEGLIYGDAKRRAVTMAEFSKALEETPYFENIEVLVLEPYEGSETMGVFKLSAHLKDQRKGSEGQ
jgi:type IV pilus assembly protein PilM